MALIFLPLQEGGQTPTTYLSTRQEYRQDSRGYVKVNARLETTVPGIWALGDVKGGPAFTHISYNDYQIVYANLFEIEEYDHRKSLACRIRFSLIHNSGALA